MNILMSANPSAQNVPSGRHELDHGQLRVITDLGGKGRAFIVLHERGSYADFAQHLVESLSSKNRAILVEVNRIDDTNWRSLTGELRAALNELKIRQASYVVFGSACALVQNLAVEELKIIRTLVLVDGESRPHPSRWLKFLDRLEQSLPLGLPFRNKSRGFDGRSFLQGIRCPVLIASTNGAGQYLLSQGDELALGLPTSWRVKIGSKRPVEELSNYVLDFEQVPAKCSQKR